MTQTLKNMSRRLVSLRGNSGQSWHIPPGASIALPPFETVDNAKLRKLEERHVLKVARPEARQPEADDEDHDRSRKSRSKR